MTITRYYYPSDYGTANFAPSGSGRKGTADFHGAAQYPAGSYTVIEVNSKTPGVFKLILDYTGKGTGTTDTVYQTKYSTKSLTEVSDGTYDFLLSDKKIPANYSHDFTGKSQPFQPNPAFKTDPTQTHATALSHSLFEAAFAGAGSEASTYSAHSPAGPSSLAVDAAPPGHAHH